jgi:hypothetical protein
MPPDDSAATAATITDEERGLVIGHQLRRISTPSMTATPPATIGNPRPGSRPLTRQDEFEVWRQQREREEAAKEAWKEANPRWPFDAGLRHRSRFIFSEEEIKQGALEWAGFVPGVPGVLATILSVVGSLRQQMSANGGVSDMAAQALAALAAMILAEAAAKKIKLRQARKILEEALRVSGLDDKLARKSADILIKIQRTVKTQFRKHLKKKD